MLVVAPKPGQVRMGHKPDPKLKGDTSSQDESHLRRANVLTNDRHETLYWVATRAG